MPDRTEFVEFTKPELQLIKAALQDLAAQYREDLKETPTALNSWRLNHDAMRLNEISLLAVKVWRAIGECEKYERLEAELATPEARALLAGRI